MVFRHSLIQIKDRGLEYRLSTSHNGQLPWSDPYKTHVMFSRYLL